MLDTTLKIHISTNVRRYGHFQRLKRDCPRIVIRPGEGQVMAMTLFHELLHFWVWWLRKSGAPFSRDKDKEHRLIYRMERCLDREINKVYGG